jgi:hypothetical protein
MLKETLFNEPITASITVGCSSRGEHPNAERSEFARISQGLELICDPRRNHVFIIYGRAHTVIRSRPGDSSKGTFWRPASNGGGEAQIVLALVDEPAQRVMLSYQLVRAAAGASGWLNCTFSPTTILAGNNVHPATIANPKTGEICAYPSSQPRVMEQVCRLGFDVLEELYQQARSTKCSLFDPNTAAAIKAGEFRLIRAQWCAYIPTPDVPKFLQLIGVLVGHTIGRGKGLIQIADHLGFEAKTFTENGDVNGVMLRKRHGKKTLFSLCFYDKRKRVADMRQGKSLLPAEAATIRENVRFDITAHGPGIVAIIKAARKRLRLLQERGVVLPGGDWTEDFLRRDVEPSARLLQRAIFVLSLRLDRGVLVRRSFAEWLVPHMIRDVLRLDVIACFTRRNFHALVALEDKVAVAWCAAETIEVGAWPKRLAKDAGCSVQTLYTRREEWLREYGIDIAAPHALYRDLLYFGPPSLTQPEDRSALLSAVRRKEGKEAIRLHDDAARNFDRQRIEIVGKTIGSRLHEMEVKVALKTAPLLREGAAAAPSRIDFDLLATMGTRPPFFRQCVGRQCPNDGHRARSRDRR